MAVTKWCPTHGRYEGKVCPTCKPPKKSKKYGRKTIIIPPNMRAR